MQATASTDPHHCTHSCHDCHCCHQKPPSYVKTLELICSVAFVIFAVSIAPLSFALSFVLGVTYQCTLIAFKIKTSLTSIARPGCGQGNGEMFAGRSLLPYEIVLVTALLFFEHLQHHPEFFVPFLSFWVGARVVSHLQESLKSG